MEKAYVVVNIGVVFVPVMITSRLCWEGLEETGQRGRSDDVNWTRKL